MTDVIVVLGYRQRADGRPSAIQRWRVEVALGAAGPETTLVFTGAGGEAEAMAQLARDGGFPEARMVYEREATTTSENVTNCAALIADDVLVRFASDSLHAARARRYWRHQFPGRAAQLGPALATRWWRHPLAAAGCGAYEIVLRARGYRP